MLHAVRKINEVRKTTPELGEESSTCCGTDLNSSQGGRTYVGLASAVGTFAPVTHSQSIDRPRKSL